MTFKERIKELRTESNITQAELAAKLGKGESAIRTWETGRAKPDVDTLIKLSKIFDCSVDYLLGTSLAKKINPLHELNSELNKIDTEISITEKEKGNLLLTYQATAEKLRAVENHLSDLYREREKLKQRIKYLEENI